MPPLRAVFFDAAGTLMFLPRAVGAHYAEVAAGHFGLKLDHAALDAAFRRAWRAMPPREATAHGGPRGDDDYGWWRDLVRLVLLDVAPREMAGGSFDFLSYFDAVWHRFAEPGAWAAYPEVSEVLDAVAARGLRLGVVSNFDSRLLANLRDLGLLSRFEHVILSSQVGADKPHARIFHAACARFGLAPAQCLHVGDDPRCDWEGAASAGLHAYRLDRTAGDLRGVLAAMDAITAPSSGSTRSPG